MSFLGKKGEPPQQPLNLMADFAGGSMTCALGIMMALYERSVSGKGQVVDNSMVEGSAYVGEAYGKAILWQIWRVFISSNMLLLIWKPKI